MPRMIRPAGSMASLALILVAALAAQPARAQAGSSRPDHLSFDPATCTRDPQGMVHFAVNRRVFRQPAASLRQVVGRSPEVMNRLPVPPKPDEPEGCPDHPIQGLAFSLWPFSALPSDTPNSASHHADALFLTVNGGTVPAEYTLAFTLICNRSRPDDPKLRDTSIQGMVGCIKPFRVPDDYVYQTTEYESPSGEKITIMCLIGIGEASRSASCAGGYRLHDDLVLNFDFPSKSLAIADFIAADQEVRRRIAAAEIRNYPWQAELGSDKKRGP